MDENTIDRTRCPLCGQPNDFAREKGQNRKDCWCVFETFPAILKGWFDRVWGPGIAYDHAGDFGSIKPRLNRLRHLAAVTTLGSPWWVDLLLLRQPVKRVLKSALLGACAPTCRFKMLSLYKCEQLPGAVVDRFSAKITRMLRNWK